MKMSETEINDYARQLLEARGDKALVEAAQRVIAFETKNDHDQATYWRQVENALRLMRGPRAS